MPAFGLASVMLVVATAGQFGSAHADQNEALARALSSAFTPAQISHLVTTASAVARTDQEAQSLDQLKRLLDVNGDVALALLRIVDRPEIVPQDVPEILAQSAVQYRAVIDRLSDIAADDTEARRMVADARTALRAGRFGDAEMLLRKLEDREVASSGDPPDGNAQAATVATQHLISAAQAGTVLGEIALMKLRYSDATKHFQVAQQRLSLLSQAEPAGGPVQSDDIVVQKRSGDPPAAPVMQTAEIAQADPARAPAQRGQDVAAIGLPDAATNQMAAAMAAPRNLPEQPPRVPTDGTTGSTEILVLLLRRGDALLALGDVSSARLLYERAAAAGDGRGATGAGKTYDPAILLAIGARGIQADPVAAATWYRRAIELGDRSAAERLTQMSQRSER
jgi:TPR repeat protein